MDKNNRYELFKKVVPVHKMWQYICFMMDMEEEYRKSLKYNGIWFNFKIVDQDEFESFIKNRVEEILSNPSEESRRYIWKD